MWEGGKEEVEREEEGESREGREEEKSQRKGSKPIFMCGVCRCVVVCDPVCGFVCCQTTYPLRTA